MLILSTLSSCQGNTIEQKNENRLNLIKLTAVLVVRLLILYIQYAEYAYVANMTMMMIFGVLYINRHIATTIPNVLLFTLAIF